MIDTPVAITLIICVTLISLALIGGKGKQDDE